MTKLIKIGNSQGIRIPKALIEQANLFDKKLEFKIVKNGLLIQPVKKVRQGWKEQFDMAAKLQESEYLDKECIDAPLSDSEDWEW